MRARCVNIGRFVVEDIVVEHVDDDSVLFICHSSSLLDCRVFFNKGKRSPQKKPLRDQAREANQQTNDTSLSPHYTLYFVKGMKRGPNGIISKTLSP